MHLDFGVVPDGYGWVFPNDGHLNVGLYCESQQQKITRSSLAEYIQKKLGTPKFYGVIGQYLGMGGRAIRTVIDASCWSVMPLAWSTR